MIPEKSKSNNPISKAPYASIAQSPFWMQRMTISSPAQTHHYHYHDCYELYYLYSGERYYFIKDKTYHIKPGTLVLINAFDIHCTSNFVTSGYDRILINFNMTFLEKHLEDICDINLLACFHQQYHIIRLTSQEQRFIENFLLTMMNEYTDQKIGYTAYLKAALLQLLLFINRHNNQLINSDLHYANSTHRTISKITEYLNVNYSKEIKLTDVSSVFFISPYHLSRTFKRVTGFTFIEYLNAVRTKRAQELLWETNLSITEIAEAVGYKSSTHFGRIFREVTGTSPLAYRKNNNKMTAN